MIFKRAHRRNKELVSSLSVLCLSQLRVNKYRLKRCTRCNAAARGDSTCKKRVEKRE